MNKIDAAMNDLRKNTPERPDLTFKQIYDEFQPKILRYVTNMMGEFEAEDVTQEIFARASQAMVEFRGECKVSTWLYRIATNAVLDRLRSAEYKRIARQSESISENEESAAEMDDRNIWTGEKIPTPELQVVRKEMSACVQDYIRHLPESYRSVLALAEFEGMSNQEIGDILRIKVGTVKIRLHRARERLKRDLIATCPSYWVDGNEFLPDLKNL